MSILDFNLDHEVDAVVAASEYLEAHGGDREQALIDLKNRAWHVMAQRITDAAIASAQRHGLHLVPVVNVVALGMAQWYGWLTRHPLDAKEFYEAIDLDVVPPDDEEKRVVAALSMSEAASSILRSLRLIEASIKEQADG